MESREQIVFNVKKQGLIRTLNEFVKELEREDYPLKILLEVKKKLIIDYMDYLINASDSLRDEYWDKHLDEYIERKLKEKVITNF